MFPGCESFSYCENFSQAHLRQEAIFYEAESDLLLLSELLKTMLLGNWNMNFEIANIINKFK